MAGKKKSAVNFQTAINTLCNEVDLYKGISSFFEEKNKKSHDTSRINSLFKISGIDFIQKVIKDNLGEIADNIFVEYSTVASTLDPDKAGQLVCFSYIDGDKEFKEDIEKFYTACIEKTSEEIGISVYQHPNFLFDIKGEKYVYTYSEDKKKNDSWKEVNPFDEEKDKEYISKYKTEYWSVEEIKGKKSTSIQAFPLNRPFEHIVKEAQDFYKRPLKEEKDRKRFLSLEELHRRLHQNCHVNITKGTNRASHYISFPIIGSLASNQLEQYKVSNGGKTYPLQGIGACFLYIETKKETALPKKIVQDLTYQIGQVIRFYSSNYLFNMGLRLQEAAKKETELAKQQAEFARREAIKSAKAAIMSRNMSHNLGSHVMAYLKQKLGSVASIISEKVLADITIKDNQFQGKTDLQLPFLVGLGRFIGYLQERQDYIATIATDYIPYGAPVNMKDAIYDELNPDLRFIRHNDETQNRPANILMSYIAKSEGLSRENMDMDEIKKRKRESGHLEIVTKNDICFGFNRYYNGGKIQNFGCSPDQCDSKNDALTMMREINFNLPGGLVGRQALFSIIENTIRNAAKHGNRAANTNLNLVFDVIDGEQFLKSPGITDRLSRRISEGEKQKEYKLATRHDSLNYFKIYQKTIGKEKDLLKGLYIVTITDNQPLSDENLSHIRKAMIEPYIDPLSGIMTTGNKGLKEMRISAAWLRREADENKYFHYPENLSESPDIGNSTLPPLFLADRTGEGYLRYVFCLPKNRFSVIITDGFPQEIICKFKDLSSDNPTDWNLMSREQFISDENKSYDFIIECAGIAESVRPYSSNRVITFHSTENENKKNLRELNTFIDNEEKLKEYIYTLFCEDAGDPIYIWDSKTCAEKANEVNTIPKTIQLGEIEFNRKGAKYAYRTHHSADSQFLSYWREYNKGKYKTLECVDAVTGDNSSDRLVRREKLDSKWYYSHLYAMKKKVAIFDERIFRIIHNVDENDFLDDNLMFVKQFGHNSLSVFQKHRGVEVFSILKHSETKFFIVGCTSCTWGTEKQPYKNHLNCIATITKAGKNSNKIKIQFKDKTFAKKFDYISIHQGILDKLYEGFGFKQYANGANNQYKFGVTQCLSEAFMNNPEVIEMREEEIEKIVGREENPVNKYIPRFIIHSGRAKPTCEDMPQKQPFIQYAAIENAVKDSKYSLIELLDYARFE